ncbi:MAG: DUF2877 domain-containing protein [Nocardioides sp.]|nr:DUF2877 domain-containing protein [Nocardioides sp.]
MARPSALADPLPVACPPRVAERLAAAPDGPLEILHACADSVHLDLGGSAIGVVSVAGAGLPHEIRTMASRVTTGTAPSAYLDRGTLYLGGRALVTRRLVDVRAPRLDAARVPKASPAAVLGTPRPRAVGLVVRRGAITPATVADLVGRGDGLTPFGDDVLCGWLALHRAVGVPTPAVDDAVRRALPRTTTLSATLLECALAGEVADLVAGYVRAVGTPGEPDARVALESLGHSSGRGLAHGLDLARADLAARAAA